MPRPAPVQRAFIPSDAADPAASPGGLGASAEPGEAAGVRRLPPTARTSAAGTAAGDTAAAPGRNEAASRARAGAPRTDVDLATLAGLLRSERARWTVQRRGAEPRAAADQAADWIEASLREAAAAGTRWQAMASTPNPTSTAVAAVTSMTLLRDGEPRHRVVLEDGRWRWQVLGAAGPAQVLVLPSDALQRLADRLP